MREKFVLAWYAPYQFCNFLLYGEVCLSGNACDFEVTRLSAHGLSSGRGVYCVPAGTVVTTSLVTVAVVVLLSGVDQYMFKGGESKEQIKKDSRVCSLALQDFVMDSIWGLVGIMPGCVWCLAQMCLFTAFQGVALGIK